MSEFRDRTTRAVPKTPLRYKSTLGTVRRLWTDRRGVAAVEFAFIFPVMLLLYIGTVDVSRNVMSSRKVDIASRTISDLVSQQPTGTPVTAATISTIFAASASIMQPYPTDALTMTVSGVTIQAKSNGTCCDAMVNWSYMQQGTTPGSLRTCSTTVPLTQTADGTAASATTIPSSTINANTQAGYTYSASKVTYLIIADVRYTYQPLFSQAAGWISGAFQKTTYMVPRSANGTVSLAKPVTAAATGQTGCST